MIRRKQTAALLATFALTIGASLALSACGEDGITCDVTWWSGAPNSSDVLGESSYNYGTENADKAVARCEADQAADPDRPADANGHSCDCETN